MIFNTLHGDPCPQNGPVTTRKRVGVGLALRPHINVINNQNAGGSEAKRPRSARRSNDIMQFPALQGVWEAMQAPQGVRDKAPAA